MLGYIARRLLLIIPTLLGIMVINFIVIQFAPGGPVEQVLAEMQGNAADATAAFSGQSGDLESTGQSAAPGGASGSSQYRGAQGLDPAIIEEIEKQFGFDKPVHERFFSMLWDYARFDFGSSYFRDQTVIDLVLDKLPVSISLGLWTTLFVYLISIPLGIRKAVKDGSSFDVWSSGAIVIGYAIPGFLFAILLIVLFAGGRYFDVFPLRGLTS
ncbi:MAG: microcin ABC transporter permease, partial [Granulosicoccus sp.]